MLPAAGNSNFLRNVVLTVVLNLYDNGVNQMAELNSCSTLVSVQSVNTRGQNIMNLMSVTGSLVEKQHSQCYQYMNLKP